MRITTIVLVCSIAMACNNSGESDEPVKSLSDSLLQQVLDGHDVAMNKWMEGFRYDSYDLETN
ncbi:MAG: hypothetical protein QM640_10910 [Niabella sp.]